jgi:hypothetical protein
MLLRQPDEFRARAASARGGFSIVAHVHHLADLESEAYAVRIRRILSQESPHLSDFEGDRIARERGYRSRDASSGLERFTAARLDNLARLRAARGTDWARTAQQEGVGEIRLGEMPSRMFSHDCSHATEILNLLREIAPELIEQSRLTAFAEGEPCARAA